MCHCSEYISGLYHIWITHGDAAASVPSRWYSSFLLWEPKLPGNPSWKQPSCGGSSSANSAEAQRLCSPAASRLHTQYAEHTEVRMVLRGRLYLYLLLHSTSATEGWHCFHNCLPFPVNFRFSHQPIQQNPIMHGLGHMGGQGVHPGLRPNQMLAEQQQQQQAAQQQAAQQQQQQYLRQQQALRVSHLKTVIMIRVITTWIRAGLMVLGLITALFTGLSKNK